MDPLLKHPYHCLVRNRLTVEGTGNEREEREHGVHFQDDDHVLTYLFPGFVGPIEGSGFLPLFKLRNEQKRPSQSQQKPIHVCSYFPERVWLPGEALEKQHDPSFLRLQVFCILLSQHADTFRLTLSRVLQQHVGIPPD
jgi:hypothetical protein